MGDITQATSNNLEKYKLTTEELVRHLATRACTFGPPGSTPVRSANHSSGFDRTGAEEGSQSFQEPSAV